MITSATNQDYSFNQTSNETGRLCHPNLRGSYTCSPTLQNSHEYYQENPILCDDCSAANGIQTRTVDNGAIEYCTEQPPIAQHHLRGDNKHFTCVTHSCPLGTIVGCSDCKQNDYTQNQPIRDCNGCFSQSNTVNQRDYKPIDRSCCEKNISWTEPRICRCNVYESKGDSKCRECECGTVQNEKSSSKKKGVRFADEVAYIDCDKAFQNLEAEDVKGLCRCCQECVKKGTDACIGKPMLVYELPEPKSEDKSVTHKDFGWKKTPRKEMPPWHPNVKDRWNYLDVPSLAETTYQSDFKPPPVSKAKRRPVYLAPQREEIDPCQQLSEDFSAWKKTSTGQNHVCHSTCPNCDKDLHRVHVRECGVRDLPAPYECHADGDVGGGEDNKKFTLCETGNVGDSRYWWKRSCCETEDNDYAKPEDLPPDLLKPACPVYTTSYRHDYRPPEVTQQLSNSDKCGVCDYFTQTPYVERPITLCTKDPNQQFISQRGGMI